MMVNAGGQRTEAPDLLHNLMMLKYPNGTGWYG
jgi:hypothetical protein